MQHQSATVPIDQARSGPSLSARSRSGLHWHLPLFCVGLLLAALLIGAANTSDSAPDLMDLSKIVAVVSFVASMVALCMGMIGDSYCL